MHRSGVRPSACPILFLTLIRRAAHTKRDSLGGSMRRGRHACLHRLVPLITSFLLAALFDDRARRLRLRNSTPKHRSHPSLYFRVSAQDVRVRSAGKRPIFREHSTLACHITSVTSLTLCMCVRDEYRVSSGRIYCASCVTVFFVRFLLDFPST